MALEVSLFMPVGLVAGMLCRLSHYGVVCCQGFVLMRMLEAATQAPAGCGYQLVLEAFVWKLEVPVTLALVQHLKFHFFSISCSR